MDISNDVLAKKRVLFSKLAEAGFIEAADGEDKEWRYEETFMNGDLKSLISVDADGRVTCSVVDTDTGDDYLPMNVEAYSGTYVGEAREEYRTLLERIAGRCFGDVPFASDQANRIASAIEREFGAMPEHPFSKDEGAVFRHMNTGKWFAIDMCIRRGKLDDPHPYRTADDMIDVMNVKIYPDALDDLLKEPGICRCYHMNKKMWVTLTMDDRLADERVMELVRKSYDLTSGGSAVSKSNRKMGERSYWMIPSNPANYDVAQGFRDSGNNTLAWHHRINVMPGDIVYIYQTEPVASIMFECEVLESFLPRPEGWGRFAPYSKYRMTLRLIRSFRKGEYPRSWMNKHGIKKTVRGQRSAPPELVKAIGTDI